ncbi:MAG: glycerol-3-phosphate acyltransferase, partial [Alphaproteobacteria bacterium]
MTRLNVIGAGAWGTALAIMAEKAGNEVRLWTRREDHAEALNRSHENKRYLPGVKFSEKIRATTDPLEAADADILLLVSPAQHLRLVLTLLRPHLSPGTVLVICAKGIEQDSGLLMSEVSAEVAPDNPVAILSGPNFAREIAMGLPAAATLATEDIEIGKLLTKAVGLPAFRPY